MSGTLVLGEVGYAGELTRYDHPVDGEYVQQGFPVSLSDATMREFIALLNEQQLSAEDVPEPDWRRLLLNRCFALSTPMQETPCLFEYRSLWETPHSAPWDFVAYPGWVRDPQYGREHNHVWSVEGGADQAMSFLIEQLGIGRHVDSIVSVVLAQETEG